MFLEAQLKIGIWKNLKNQELANLVIGRKGKYKNLTIDESQNILKKTDDHIFERDIKYDEFGDIIKPDPEDLAHGGRTGTGLNYLMGEDDQNMRVPLGKGKLVDAGRRWFLQLMGGAAAGVGVAKSGLFSLLKAGKPGVVKSLTSVPIGNAPGMPVWYKGLVNRIIKEGNEIESGMERVIVHSSELPGSKTKLYVTQELDTGNVMVDIGTGKHGFVAGHLGQPIRLEYKAAEAIEPTISKTGKVTHKGGKTKPEFNIEEAEFSGGHPENVKFEESTLNKYGEQGSDLSEVEQFATGKSGVSSGKSSGVLNEKGSKQLRKDLSETKKRQQTLRLSPGQLKQYLDQIDDQIRIIKEGGPIPEEVIQTIRKDPKFRSVWQNQKSADPDLREMEEVLLEYGQKHASGGLAHLLGE